MKIRVLKRSFGAVFCFPAHRVGAGETDPVTLTIPNKVVYSVHEYPPDLSGNGSYDMATQIAAMNAGWGNLETDNIAPVWVGEIGSNMTSSSDQAWIQGVLDYMNGDNGAEGGPTFSGNEQPVSGSWWQWGAAPAQDPEGVETAWGSGTFWPAQQAATDQLAAGALPITITSSSASVATTDATRVKPFASVVITDDNVGQTETASVTLSAAANGTLSDPTASTDGSTVAAGAWTMSGSSPQVTAALDGIVFKPTENQVAAGEAVSTVVTASIKNTAGETASTASTVTATQVAAQPPSVDTLALNISEDAWRGDAEFTVSVDGKQIGGHYTASALHSSGDAGTFLLTGNWGTGVNDVKVGFINDAYGGSASTDRNLYVNTIAENGVTYAGTTATMDAAGTHTFAVGGTTPTASGPMDHLTLNLSEDAWQGNAEFVFYVDGKAVTTPQVVTALRDASATQGFSFAGNFGAGTHTVGVGFVNDGYGGSASADRNLYINGITLNGSDVFSGLRAQDSNGISTFTVNTTH